MRLPCMISRTVCDRFKHRPQRYRNSVLAAWNSVRVQQKNTHRMALGFVFLILLLFLFFLTEKNGGKKRRKKRKDEQTVRCEGCIIVRIISWKGKNSHQFLLRWVPIFPLVRSALYLCAKTQTTTVVSMLMCISFSFFFFFNCWFFPFAEVPNFHFSLVV